MKDKIFQKLKQTYSEFGLGADVLQAHAESLANIGLVTDENVDAVVAAQKPFLMNLQKNTDSRVSRALEKAKETAKAEFEAEAQRKNEETKQREIEEAKRREKEKEMPEWYKAEKAANEKLLKDLLESNKTIKESYDAIKAENDQFKADKAKADRNASIVSKAKELGIPQWRIEEGFSIADNADEAAISEHLSMVSNNIKAQSLPGNRTVFPQTSGNVTKADADAVAKSLVV